jgi:hypothetical protein
MKKDFHYGRNRGSDNPRQNLEIVHPRYLVKEEQRCQMKKASILPSTATFSANSKPLL